MDSDPSSLEVEVGRIVFRSWEHEWQTGIRETSSVATAKRLLPNDVTQPVYEILERWEQQLLRLSLPFSPYGLRIRPANNEWMAFAARYDHLVELAHRSLPLTHLCPNWDAALPQPPEKHLKYGNVLRAPSSDCIIESVYEVKWQTALVDFRWTAPLDVLLREFSPRYKERGPYG
jgi:hypothetical protein